MEQSPSRWVRWTALVASVAGFGIALYLTVDHFSGTPPVCSASGIVDCAKVTTSGESYLFHVPVALLGLLFFTVLTVVNAPPLWGERAPWWLVYVRLALVVGGMVDVLWLLYSELFTIKAICLWCTGVHALTFVLFVLVVATYPAMAEQTRLRRG
ncbi:MAG TPA: vitamin K epoxide reductase family protein [Acidimicrobiales bacterium]|nr:vitamin K epoxide reductase family protein [Acidimicrobiales bacterium]